MEILQLAILLRHYRILAPIIENEVSAEINDSTESKYRATTLSTFSLLKNIPYALSVYLLTSLLDKVSAFHMARLLGYVMAGVLVVYLAYKARSLKNQPS